MVKGVILPCARRVLRPRRQPRGLHRRRRQGLLHRRQHQRSTPSTTPASQEYRQYITAVQRHGLGDPGLRQTGDLPRQRHAHRRRPGDRHGGDFTVAQDLANFGQAGPKHGSAPIGGATDFLPVVVGCERAMAAGCASPFSRTRLTRWVCCRSSPRSRSTASSSPTRRWRPLPRRVRPHHPRRVQDRRRARGRQGAAQEGDGGPFPARRQRRKSCAPS